MCRWRVLEAIQRLAFGKVLIDRIQAVDGFFVDMVWIDAGIGKADLKLLLADLVSLGEGLQVHVQGLEVPQCPMRIRLGPP